MKAGLKLLVIILGLLLMIGLSAGWVVDKASASIGEDLPKKCWKYGDKQKAVTVPEWRHITYDITHKELVKLLDGPGTKQKHGMAGYWYPICGMSPKHGRVIVTYDRGEPESIMWFEVHGGVILDRTLKAG